MRPCTSPAPTKISTPFRMGFPATSTCKLRISSMTSSLADTTLQANAQELLGFHREFHGQFLEYFLAEAIDDDGNRVFCRKAPALAVKKLILPDARSRGFVL